jgi:8-oxo-dGTP pyrophosphatase MutT (NUDIX family)
MKFDPALIDKLRAELAKPLPGEKAQYRMAPPYRPNLTKEEIMKFNPRVSGVMLLLYEKDGLLNLVFTQRHSYAGVHSGQMSFPGGKKDEEDANLTETALRETFEEVGVQREEIELIGNLSELYIPPSNFLVQPVVGFAANTPVFHPHEAEVEKVVEIPVDFFLDKQNINYKTEITLVDNHKVTVPAYIFGRHIIWGATAIMLSEFTFILEQIINSK